MPRARRLLNSQPFVGLFNTLLKILPKTLKALRYGPLHKLVTEIREKFNEAVVNGNDVIFEWLPSHCGIIGNVLADAAARADHEGERTILLPLSIGQTLLGRFVLLHVGLP